jgi:hypothetical protein
MFISISISIAVGRLVIQFDMEGGGDASSFQPAIFPDVSGSVVLAAAVIIAICSKRL